jgi:predicted nucleic acid-binding protein
MRILVDTNVVLDVLLKRDPWTVSASAMWKAIDDGQLVGYITASTITDIFYVARRLTALDTAQEAVQTCLDAFEICAVDRQILERAINLAGKDFEDNLQIACAEADDLDAIVSRDLEGLASTSITVLTPDSLLEHLRSASSGMTGDDQRTGSS